MAFDSSQDKEWQKQVEYMAKIYEMEEEQKKDNIINNLQQELERYKNIIDELEKYAEEEIIEGNKRPEDYVRFGIEDYVKGQIVAFKHILDKLKELKGE